MITLERTSKLTNNRYDNLALKKKISGIPCFENILEIAG